MLLKLFQEKTIREHLYTLLCGKNNINSKRVRVHTQKFSNYRSILFMDIIVNILNKGQWNPTVH